jgi:hypothetical protein
VGLAASLMVVFAALAGIGLAGSSLSAAQYEYGGQYGKKVAVCHKGKKTLSVSVNAWPAHRAHGDVLGTCAQARAKKGKGPKAAKSATAGKPSNAATPAKGKSAAAKGKKG